MDDSRSAVSLGLHCEQGSLECKVFKENYDKLTNILPAKNLSQYFVSANVITMADEEEILAEKTSLDQATALLHKLGHPLEVGVASNFYILLNIMEDHGNVATKDLAKEMKTQLSSLQQESPVSLPPPAVKTSAEPKAPKKTQLFSVPSKIVSEFTSIVSRIEEILMGSNEMNTLNAVKSVCWHLPISSNSNKRMFTTEQLGEIDACSNFKEIFRKLRFHLRWDDYLILTAILDRLDSEECEELLGKFESKIDCQMKLEQIFEEHRKEKREVPKGFHKMVAIVKKKYSRITKEEYDQLKCFIAEQCGVEPYVLSPFLNMSPSSLLLEWLIPSTAISHMVETTMENKQIFINASFIFLKISDTVVLDSRNEESQKVKAAAEFSSVISQQLDELVASLSPKDQEATLSTLTRIFDNIIHHPNDDKYRQIKLASKTLSSKVWQYPAGEEFMKMSGWVVEGDHVRLRDDSHIQTVSQLLTSLCTKHTSPTATSVVPLPDDQFHLLVEAFQIGDIPCIQKMLSVSHISPNGRVYSTSGSSMDVLHTAIITQQLEVLKLLVKNYSMDFYLDISPHILSVFHFAPQSFIIGVLKLCGIKASFRYEGYSLLHYAIMINCPDVVRFLLETSSDVDINVTDDELRTPLHLAYITGCTQIADYLIQHGADVYALDKNWRAPYEYIDGHPVAVALSQHLQNKRRIHHTPFSTEHQYYMKLCINRVVDEEAVSLTMEHFPSLKDHVPTRPNFDIDRASALKEFTQYITKGSSDDPWRRPLSQEQRGHFLFS